MLHWEKFTCHLGKWEHGIPSAKGCNGSVNKVLSIFCIIERGFQQWKALLGNGFSQWVQSVHLDQKQQTKFMAPTDKWTQHIFKMGHGQWEGHACWDPEKVPSLQHPQNSVSHNTKNNLLVSVNCQKVSAICWKCFKELTWVHTFCTQSSVVRVSAICCECFQQFAENIPCQMLLQNCTSLNSVQLSTIHQHSKIDDSCAHSTQVSVSHTWSCGQNDFVKWLWLLSFQKPWHMQKQFVCLPHCSVILSNPMFSQKHDIECSPWQFDNFLRLVHSESTWFLCQSNFIPTEFIIQCFKDLKQMTLASGLTICLNDQTRWPLTTKTPRFEDCFAGEWCTCHWTENF